MKNKVDTIINSRWILPIKPENKVFENSSIVINNSIILDIDDSDIINKKYESKDLYNLNTHCVMPGLINNHTHLSMSLFKGIADDLNLDEWLRNEIWPLETKHVDQEFVELGSKLAIIELIKSGSTCFNDMYFFPEVTAYASLELGIRASLGLITIDFPSNYAQNSEEYLEKGLDTRDKLKNETLVSFTMAPHAPYTVGDETLIKIFTLSNELDLPVHMHIHETENEIMESVQKYNQRPIKRLFNLGLINPNFIGIHAVHLNSEDISILSKSKANLVSCPVSNLKLGSGIPSASLENSKKINLSFGTDGSASNNKLDILSEARLGSLLLKGISKDATKLNSNNVLECLTINAAKSLGMENKIGSIEKNKAADLIAINFNKITSQPIFNPISHIVNAIDRENITHSWVNGRCIMDDRNIQTIDENLIIQKVQRFVKKFY